MAAHFLLLYRLLACYVEKAVLIAWFIAYRCYRTILRGVRLYP